MGRLQFLDGVRALLALWVVVGHLGKMVGASLPLLGNPAVAVDVFMLLSGFFIAATFESLHRQHPPATATRYFLIRRVMRIWPLYAVLLTLCWWLLGPLNEAKLLAAQTFPMHEAAEAAIGLEPLPQPNAAWVLLHYTMLNGIVPAQAQLSPLPDWSLSLEFQFYLLFPLLAFVLRRRPLLLCFAAAGLAFVSPRLFGDYLTPGSVAHFHQPAALVYRLNIFLLGVMAWRLFAAPAEMRKYPHVELLAIVLCLVPMGAQQALGCFAVLYLLAYPAGPLVKVLGSRPMAALGRISFTIYLVHLPLIRLLVAALIEVPGFATMAPMARLGVTLLCGLPLVLGVAQLFYMLIEGPGIRLAHRWTSAPRRAAPAGEPRPPALPETPDASFGLKRGEAAP